MRTAKPTPIVLILILMPILGVAAAPQAELWPRWERHTPSSQTVIDHSLWGEFLERYLVVSHPSGINRVAYDEVDSRGRELINSYIRLLTSHSPDSLSRREQLPYWINLYNALTIRLILEHLPLESIRDIDDPWDTTVVTIDGVDLTLNDIEHRIIRPIWRDTRIHFLVNCASIGCPNLQPEPLAADSYERVANRAAREYIAHPRGARFDDSRLILSSIFNWYAGDFGETRDSLLAYLSNYAPPRIAGELGNYRGRIRYEYDWSLNRP